MHSYKIALDEYNENIAQIDIELASLIKGADAFIKVIPTDVYSGVYNNNCINIYTIHAKNYCIKFGKSRFLVIK